MSKKNQQEENPLKKEVILNPDDIKCISKFFEFFELETPSSLTKAIKEFEANPSFENQEELKFQLTNAMSTDSKVLEIDEMFKPVVEACTEYAYDRQFERDFSDIVGKEK